MLVRGVIMLKFLSELAVSVFAVYGGYSLLRDIKRFILEVIEKRRS